MTYTTLTYNGTEKALADWGVAAWRREVNNQASDSVGFDLVAAADGAEVFPYGAMVTLQIGRTPASGPSANGNGTPVTGVTSWTSGSKWFDGWRVQNVRVGSPEMEGMRYKFAGPWDFFFERLVFQKLWLTWNGVKQIADWRSQVVLGMSVNALTGAGDTVTGTTTTNLMSIAQQLIEIVTYCANQSSYEQTVNGLGWPAGAQFQSDTLTTDSNGNYQLKTPARTNVSIPDFIPGYAGSNNDIASGTAGLVLRAPLDAVNDMTCAECLRRMLRWIGAMGSPVVWFDYTQTPPMLRVNTRDDLPSITLPLQGGGVAPPYQNGGGTEAIKIQRRDDLMPSAVAFKYRISGQVNGQPYTEIYNDIAAVVDGTAVEGIGIFGNLLTPGGGALSSDAQTQLPLQARRFAAQIATFDFEGFSYNQASATIATAALDLSDPSSGSAALAFWVSLFPELAGAGSLAFYHDAGGAIAPTVTDPTGAAINTGTFANILMDGTVAPWMYVNNSPTSESPGQCVEATVSAWFTYSDNAATTGDTAVNPGSAACHQKTIKVRLTNLSSGTYQSRPEVTFGEPVPYGLPGYIFAIENIPQYQGSLTVVEQEISDICPIGHCLNLSGGLVEWASMNACVQQVVYDGTHGKTQLTFGPAQHLGNADLVERLRVNRGPRWYNLIGNDLLNETPVSGPVALGKNVPLRGPSAGNKIASFQIWPTSLPDLQAHALSYSAPPGVVAWSKGNQPGGYAPSGVTFLDNGPGLCLSDGSGGTQNGQYILISFTQLSGVVGAQAVKFFELNTCENGDNTYYRTFLCTDKYHH